MAMNPPYIDSKLPAFYGNKLVIPFELNRTVSASDFSYIHVIIKTVSSNTEKYSMAVEAKYEADKHTYGYERYVECNFNNPDSIGRTFTPIVGQYYKVQIAFQQTKTSSPGYHSQVGITKCTAIPILAIDGLSGNTNNHQYTYTGTYYNADSSEKVYYYYFNIRNKRTQELYDSSGLLIHNSTLDRDANSSYDTWSPTKDIVPGEVYTIEYGVQTLNNVTVTPVSYDISNEFLVPPPSWFEGYLKADLDYDNGCVDISLHGDGLSGRFILSRASSEDNFLTWHKITEFTISNADSGLHLWKDYTIKQGVDYSYAIQMINKKGICTTHMKHDGYVVKADFEDMFLFDGKRQLRIRFNPKIGTFKNIRQESKIETLGSKYPHFFRNGNLSYKELSISGLISVLSDENELFMSQDSYQPTTQLTRENVAMERDFKLEVLSWLQNGEFKLFRSPSEGNYIVRLLNISLSPNDTLGRMLHTFTCSAYESMEYSFENLKAQGYLNIPDTLDLNHMHVRTQISLQDSSIDPDILVTDKTVSLSKEQTMKNVVITNATPNSVLILTDSNGVAVPSVIGNDGTLVPPDLLWKSITFGHKLSLLTASLEFDKVNKDDWQSKWNTFDKYTKVTTETFSYYENDNGVSLYNANAWASNSGYVNKTNNTFDYLKYLKALTGYDVGEVYYLRIFRRLLTEAEAATVNYNLWLESYDCEITDNYVDNYGYVYTNLGMLKHLTCGNGYDLEIVFLGKKTSA